MRQSIRPRADVGDRRDERRHRGDADVRPCAGGRTRGGEDEDWQADVPEHEPDETAREGRDEAPEGDSCKDEGVHSA